MSDSANEVTGVTSAPPSKGRYIPPIPDSVRKSSALNTSSNDNFNRLNSGYNRPGSSRPAGRPGLNNSGNFSNYRNQGPARNTQGHFSDSRDASNESAPAMFTERRWTDAPSTEEAPSQRPTPTNSFNRPQSGYNRNLGNGGDRGPRMNNNNGPRTKRHRVFEQRDESLEARLFGEKRTGIDFQKYDNIPVSASGKDVPAPIDSFTSVDFDAHLTSTLDMCGYDRPTPIQKYSIPIAMAGRDMIACAQTGSGKTAAFLLPIICYLLKAEIPVSSSYSKFYPSALVLGPTRELVTQIQNEAAKFTYRTSIKCVAIYGGVPSREQMQQLGGGCDIIVATPGRLVDFCTRGNIKLERVTHLILDEADRMLDMGFVPQIRDIIETFDMPTKRQTLMFSATFPREIQRLASDFLVDYIFLAVGRVGSSTDLITQQVELIEDNDKVKRDRLLELLRHCDGLTLVFVETKRGADILEDFLVHNSIEAASIHGDRSQQEREMALEYFKSGRCPVLVATDVAARGLSIPDVTHVINYDLPTHIDDYVHRIGRTGRCGATGTAISFLTDKNRGIARDLYELMAENKQQIPEGLERMAHGHHSGHGGYGSRFGGRPHRGGGGGGYGNSRMAHDFRNNGPSRAGPSGNTHRAPQTQNQGYGSYTPTQSRTSDSW